MSENDVQILLYTSYLHIIGGIETFIASFLELMSPDYSIGVYCPRLPAEMAGKISKKAKLYQNNERVSCDTLVMVRMMDKRPYTISYKKSVRMCHACKSNPSWQIVMDCDKIIHVSKASKKSFDTKGDVIYNPVILSPQKALIFVSATRIPALDKGKNAERMLKFAKKLNDAQIPFLWFNFSDAPLQGAPKGFVNVGAFQDIQPFIAKADYLVQLSDQEGFGYSVAEALENHTAVLCTPFETTKELGVKDGVNGYIIPFDLDFDLTKLYNIPKFDFTYDNESIRKKWKKIFDAKPKKNKGSEELVETRVKIAYTDIALNKFLNVNQHVMMTKVRAEEVAAKGYIEILGGG